MKSLFARNFLIYALVIVLGFTVLGSAFIYQVNRFSMEEKQQQLEGGDAIPGGQSHRVGDMVCTLGDVIAVEETITCALADGTPFTYDAVTLYGTGVIAPAPDANVVLMPMDEYTPSAPWGCDLHYGMDEVPADAPTYADKATETGAALRMVSAIPNYLVGTDGEPLYTDAGYTLIPQRDGTVLFSFEITPPADAPLARQDSYTLGLGLGSEAVGGDGGIIEGSRQAEDWVVELQAQPAPDASAGGPSSADVR